MTESPTIEIGWPRAPATRRAEPARPAPAARRSGDLFEAPLHTVPYPLEACRGAVLDVRDAESPEAGPLSPDAVLARLSRLGRL